MTRLLVARVVSALALAVTSLVMFGAAPAQACSCVSGTAKEYAERADAVFRGTIAHTDSGSMNISYDVEVDAVFKGEVSRDVVVATSPNGASCGLPNLPEGEPLIFFASGTDDAFHVTSCDGTDSGGLVTVQDVTAVLGQPREPSEPTAGTDSLSGNDDDAGLAPWLMAGGLLAAVAVGGGVLLRRRRGA